MTTLLINKEEYISSDVLFEKAPIYCKLSRTGRDLIRKKKLTDYIFAKLVDKKWTVSDGKSYKYDKVFFKKKFVNTIPEINQEKEIIDDNNVLLAPDIIQLDDNEKFKDTDNNIIEIETRGSRQVDGIYFKVKDVSSGFKMDRLDDIITNKQKHGHNEDIHYKYFNIKKPTKDGNKTSKIKKELYLTYEGMLRVLFASHSPIVKPFIKWATEKIFTLQMGTIKQKEELVGSVLGINAKVIKEVFNADRNTIPCVYLFTLNTVKELRTSMNIDNKYADDAIVAKFGFTKDLSRRTGEHITKYTKIQNVNLKLKHYSYVDPQYMANAETDIKDIMMAFKIKFDFDNEDELVIIPKELMKMVERHYELIGKNYMGHISELITRIKELEDKYERQLLTHQIELEQVKHNLELSKEKYDHELLKKDFEIIKLQMQLLKN